MLTGCAQFWQSDTNDAMAVETVTMGLILATMTGRFRSRNIHRSLTSTTVKLHPPPRYHRHLTASRTRVTTKLNFLLRQIKLHLEIIKESELSHHSVRKLIQGP